MRMFEQFDDRLMPPAKRRRPDTAHLCDAVAQKPEHVGKTPVEHLPEFAGTHVRRLTRLRPRGGNIGDRPGLVRDRSIRRCGRHALRPARIRCPVRQWLERRKAGGPRLEPCCRFHDGILEDIERAVEFPRQFFLHRLWNPDIDRAAQSPDLPVDLTDFGKLGRDQAFRRHRLHSRLEQGAKALGPPLETIESRLLPPREYERCGQPGDRRRKLEGRGLKEACQRSLSLGDIPRGHPRTREVESGDKSYETEEQPGADEKIRNGAVKTQIDAGSGRKGFVECLHRPPRIAHRLIVARRKRERRRIGAPVLADTRIFSQSLEDSGKPVAERRLSVHLLDRTNRIIERTTEGP